MALLQLRAYEDTCDLLGAFTAQARLAVIRRDNRRTVVEFTLLGLGAEELESLFGLHAAIGFGGGTEASFKALIAEKECVVGVRVEAGAAWLDASSELHALNPASVDAIARRLHKRLEAGLENARAPAPAPASALAPILRLKGIRETYVNDELDRYELLLSLVSGGAEPETILATVDSKFTACADQYAFARANGRFETLAEAILRHNFAPPHAGWDPEIVQRAYKIDPYKNWWHVCLHNGFYY
jgi:hypothetical protein